MARTGRGREQVREGSSRVMRDAQQQDAFQKRVDAAEAAIAKLTNKAEAAIVVYVMCVWIFRYMSYVFWGFILFYCYY